MNELFSVSIEGPTGSGIKLGKPFNAYGVIDDRFRVSPDSQWVIYARSPGPSASTLRRVALEVVARISRYRGPFRSVKGAQFRQFGS